jgi:hypothetical protein
MISNLTEGIFSNTTGFCIYSTDLGLVAFGGGLLMSKMKDYVIDLINAYDLEALTLIQEAENEDNPSKHHKASKKSEKLHIDMTLSRGGKNADEA